MHFAKLVSFLLLATAGSAIARPLYPESDPTPESVSIALSSRGLLSHYGSKHHASKHHGISRIGHALKKFVKLGRKVSHLVKGGRGHSHGGKHSGGRKIKHALKKGLKTILGAGAVGAGVGAVAQEAGAYSNMGMGGAVNPPMDPTMSGAGSTTMSDPNASTDPNAATDGSTTYPNASGAASTDPNAASTDPNAASDGSTDPNAAADASTDPNAAADPSTDPNAAPTDPSASGTDPNAAATSN
ncbi:hypothetical protein BDK51DRAFT_28355 [Blyttiomyces helicus]|uniref:Uncharacterized protein n=1 Tax=Blyttiomyces helicus TaxID=388810 RepID=A0A4P9WAV1_9FUNG|nr:hypothetical protein BDK51DRAFT_28355 [Blyttiomyces helicus]|eukprot:RKO89352.1 hypothetical protein BDK51DRAFT_28355 [Blyttiomyces helicus]